MARHAHHHVRYRAREASLGGPRAQYSSVAESQLHRTQAEAEVVAGAGVEATMATGSTAETGIDVDLTAAPDRDPDHAHDHAREDVARHSQRDRDPTSSPRTSLLVTYPTSNFHNSHPISCNRASRQHHRTSGSSPSRRRRRPIIKARGRRRLRRLQRAVSRRTGYPPWLTSAADGPRRLPYRCPLPLSNSNSNSNMAVAGISSTDAAGGASIAAKDTGAVGGIEGAAGDCNSIIAMMLTVMMIFAAGFLNGVEF